MVDLLTRLEAEALAQSRVEKRVIMRLLDYCDALRGDNPYPSFHDFNPDAVNGFRPFCFVLDVTESVEDPIIRFLAPQMVENNGGDSTGRSWSTVPPACPLGKLYLAYPNVFRTMGPIIVESSFADSSGREFLFRGVLMPFASDGHLIDTIVGVVNAKPKFALSRLSLVKSAAEGEANVEAKATPLADQLAECRSLVERLAAARDRTRKSLYRALKGAYVFALSSESDPEGYAGLLLETGLKRQQRAPFTPLVKLVFGADYDRTRLSEYAAALSYARREGQTAESIHRFFESHEGGLKGCVNAERAARKSTRSKAGAWHSDMAAARKALRTLPPLAEIEDASGGEREFVLVLGRRSEDCPGTVRIVRIVSRRTRGRRRGHRHPRRPRRRPTRRYLVHRRIHFVHAPVHQAFVDASTFQTSAVASVWVDALARWPEAEPPI